MWRNWYTRTFEGRVALPCEFESRHPHEILHPKPLSQRGEGKGLVVKPAIALFLKGALQACSPRTGKAQVSPSQVGVAQIGCWPGVGFGAVLGEKPERDPWAAEGGEASGELALEN